MHWEQKQPCAGDMIRVKLGSIYHFGVFVAEGEIVQFGLAPQARPTLKDSQITVCTSDLEAFLCGGSLEVAVFDPEKDKRRTAEQTVAYARNNLGRSGYHILYNNCEHFAYECVTGKPYCSQTADVRALFRSLPIVDVYVARIPQDVEVRPLANAARQSDLEIVTNPHLRVEKYCAWQLLTYALERSLGLHADQLTFSKTEHGKWITEKCSFSISHCRESVAVAVSRAEVGVDIEPLQSMPAERFADKILNDGEYALYQAVPEQDRTQFLLEKWTAKESLFKKAGGAAFVPREHDTINQKLQTKVITLADQPFVLSVATDTPDVLRSYIGVELPGV